MSRPVSSLRHSTCGPALAPTRGMEILYRLRSRDGGAFSGAIHNTVHRLEPEAR